MDTPPSRGKSHSLSYIRQLLEWGFPKEFVARDAGVTLESLEMRLYRAEKREKENGNQGNELTPSGG
jgi:hypothetical protein